MKKDKIYINGRFLTQKITGVQRYAINLLLALDQELNSYPNLKIILLTPVSGVNNDVKFKNISLQKTGKLTGHLWEQIVLPFFTNNRLLINLCNTSPVLKQHQYVVIHDAAIYRFPNAYKKMFVWWYKFMFKINSIFSLGIITVSNFSKSELIHFLKLDDRKVTIISPAVGFTSNESDDQILSRLGIAGKRFFLAVGSMDIKKNINNVVKAFNQFNSENMSLVIVGGTNKNVFNKMEVRTNDSIKYANYVNDKELISLYKNATAFVYPSLYEGFGIPPLEAMSFNCPVITSDVASLSEVCGEAALYCQPTDITSIVTAMNKIAITPELRSDLIIKGNARSSTFSYKESAAKLLHLCIDYL